jgi:hypothetical protein
MAAGIDPSNTTHINWYATGFRGEKFVEAILQIAPVALRYGATEWQVHRSYDDRYKFLQISHFADKMDFQRYWLGEEFNDWRADYQGWFQVPVVYQANELLGRGSIGAGQESGSFEQQSS